MKSLFIASLAAFFLFPSAHAEDATTPDKPSEVSTADNASSAPAVKLAPKLRIIWNCSGCEQNEKVAPLIEEAYKAAALSDGRTISDTETADLNIYQFHQRNPGMRVMFGFMAGKDRLGVRVSYNGKEHTASDYSANSLQGMNYLCESVAKKIYKSMAAQLN